MKGCLLTVAAFVVVLILIGLFVSEYEMAQSSLESEDWQDAIRLASGVAKEDEDYEAAQEVIVAARIGWAKEEASAEAWSSAAAILDSLPRARITEPTRRLIDGIKDMRATRRMFVDEVTNIRSGPGTGYRVVGRARPGDTLYASYPYDGWASVHRWETNRADTIGYVFGDLLGATPTQAMPSPRPEVPARQTDPPGPAPTRFVLRNGLGSVAIHSHQDWWDDAHLIATVNEGTVATVLRRFHIEDVPGFALERCLIRTARGIQGWVMCDDVRLER